MGLGSVKFPSLRVLSQGAIVLACSGPSPPSHQDATAQGAPAGDTEACRPPAPEGSLKLEGDLSIEDDASLEAARAYTEVTGTVRVATAFEGVVDLPNLTTVGGDFTAESAIISTPTAAVVESNVTRLRAVNLTNIGGRLWVYLNFELAELDLRSLTSAGSVFIDRNPRLQMVRFDAYPTDLSFDAPLPDCLVPEFPNVLVTSGIAGLVSCACSTECGHVVAHCE